MRQIVKGAEPASLTAHRQTPHSDYDNYGPKDDLRHALVTEQRGLCCYCMGRVHNGPTTMKIEHWRCQAHHQAEQLSYRSLLGACLGGEGQPSQFQHCDTRKGNSALQWNPAEPTHHIETRIQYELDGLIRANDSIFDNQLNDVLNLNLAMLRNNRKGALTALLDWWCTVKPVPRARIERAIHERTHGAEELVPYGPILVWWLQQKLAKMT